MIWIAGGTICIILLVSITNALVFGKCPIQLSCHQLKELERVRHSSFASNGGGSYNVFL